MPEEQVYISDEEIADYLFKNLTKLGYVPGEDELDDLVYLFFEFLIEKGIIGEVEDY